jgi:hypothetical protein
VSIPFDFSLFRQARWPLTVSGPRYKHSSIQLTPTSINWALNADWHLFATLAILPCRSRNVALGSGSLWALGPLGDPSIFLSLYPSSWIFHSAPTSSHPAPHVSGMTPAACSAWQCAKAPSSKTLDLEYRTRNTRASTSDSSHSHTTHTLSSQLSALSS